MAIPPRSKCIARSSLERETKPPEPPHNANMPSSSSSAADNSFSTSTKPLVFPPGFKFVPDDKELIFHYLKPFLRGNRDILLEVPIHLVNIYKSSPQELTEKFKKGNDKEWFFMTERTKLGKGQKNIIRSDNSGGFWKGKVAAKKVKAGKLILGNKSTLTYYVRKQPTEVKGDWLMQEFWLESSSHDNKKVDYSLCKIYLNPKATEKKRVEEEENEEEGVETIDVETLEEKVEQPPSVEYQLTHQPHFSPATLVSYQPQPHDLAYHQPQFWPAPLASPHDDYANQQQQQQQQYLMMVQEGETLEEQFDQPQSVEYQLTHQPHFSPATLDSYQPQPHDLAYNQPQFWPDPLASPQPQPYDYANQQQQYLMMVQEGEHRDDIHEQHQQHGTTIFPPPEDQVSGFGTVMTSQSNEDNNIMLTSNESNWSNIFDHMNLDFDELMKVFRKI